MTARVSATARKKERRNAWLTPGHVEMSIAKSNVTSPFSVINCRSERVARPRPQGVVKVCTNCSRDCPRCCQLLPVEEADEQRSQTGSNCSDTGLPRELEATSSL